MSNGGKGENRKIGMEISQVKSQRRNIVWNFSTFLVSCILFLFTLSFHQVCNLLNVTKLDPGVFVFWLPSPLKFSCFWIHTYYIPLIFVSHTFPRTTRLISYLFIKFSRSKNNSMEMTNADTNLRQRRCENL